MERSALGSRDSVRLHDVLLAAALPSAESVYGCGRWTATMGTICLDSSQSSAPLTFTARNTGGQRTNEVLVGTLPRMIQSLIHKEEEE